MKNEFTLTVMINTNAGKIYKAWLSSEGHSAITGSPAKVEGMVDGNFVAWDGYIQGMFLELEENKRILQAWRTAEFPAEAEDSIVEITLQENHGKTKLTLKHSNIPEGQAEGYKSGWDDFYFNPMKKYFQ
jgi:activator of HSP90 ATPase